MGNVLSFLFGKISADLALYTPEYKTVLETATVSGS